MERTATFPLLQRAQHTRTIPDPGRHTGESQLAEASHVDPPAGSRGYIIPARSQGGGRSEGQGRGVPGGGHPSGIPHSCVNGRTMVTASGGRQRRPAAFCVSLDLPPTHSSSELYFYSEGLCIYYI